jgi:hypothetical protein|tara:strand:- start:348 stop:470 length:123 start_codon:yes stop_codon:yes gene_type:complete
MKIFTAMLLKEVFIVSLFLKIKILIVILIVNNGSWIDEKK